jgi:hypothetical protein
MAMSGRIKIAAVPLALVILLGFVPMAHAAPSPNQLNLAFSGGIDSSGQQAYSQSGGALLSGAIFGQGVEPSTFTESVSASVNGLVTSGSATFSITGVMANGSSFSLSGPIGIIDAIPAEAFPLGCWDGATLPLPAACTSQVPAFYIGAGTFDVTVTHDWQTSEEMDLESAFLNPFGGPIVWGSIDPNTGFVDAGSDILLVFTYDAAAIDWQDVHNSGSLTGTLGITPVSGSFTQTTSAHEDLFAGTEKESGTLTFLAMTPSFLDASGAYSGSSTIPTYNEVDCSGFTTGIPGTCTETGFSSLGSYTLDPTSTLILGTYDITWAVPALSFSGPSTATVSQGGVSGVPEFSGGLLVPVVLGLAFLVILRKSGRGPRPSS